MKIVLLSAIVAAMLAAGGAQASDADFVGAKLLGAEVKPAPNIPDEYCKHEVEFLDVKTDKGVFQMASHNEHNGYYSGFAIRAALE